MTLGELSEDDLAQAHAAFLQFHSRYIPFFRTSTRSVSESAQRYLQGQLITVPRNSIFQYCREVPGGEYQAMQYFISESPWQENALVVQLQREVCQCLGDPDEGALLLDESGLPKQGRMSVGVQRQYCGRLGKVDNCQVGVYLAYSNPTHSTLVDHRLYLPESWVEDAARRKKCGVPSEISFKTKAELGLEMVRSFKAQALPFSWVGMDAFYGEQPWLLDRLNEEGLVYMADIPCTTRIFLSLPKTEVTPRQGDRGRHPTKERLVEGEPSPEAVRDFGQRLPSSAWTRLRIRDTERGELIAEFTVMRVWHSVDNLPFQEVWLVIRRDLETSHLRFSFSKASPDTSLERLARMQSRRYWVERALENAKGEARLDQYEVRGWRGWHHHMTMTLLAMLFLLELTLRMKEKAPLLTIQDAREILEEFLPRKTYEPKDFIELLKQKHKARRSARKSHAKKQKKWLQNLET